MTNSELKQYIRHYIEQDHTKNAIMLTGKWGTGKSHYIKNVLVPFLSSEDGGQHPCITISVYGAANLIDVSKCLYLESRLKWIQGKSEIIATGKLAAKTIVKGIAGVFNFNLDPSAEDLEQLYSSVDLSGNLIIIEDVERVQFGITALLGYINSLVEQDGVKVLLVANEDEIIQYEAFKETDPDKKATTELLNRITNNGKREFTAETKAYLASKEKTISDTILFEGDISSAITEIIESYKDETLNRFTNKDDVDEIVQIMTATRCFNLRSFLFACQKAYDIFHLLPCERECETDFLKTIFMGVVSFSLRSKAGERLKWEKGDSLSFELGNAQYPLFRFCYNYLVRQQFDRDSVKRAQEELRDYRLYDKNKSNGDKDLTVLMGWYLDSDDIVRTAVDHISERLKDPNDIAFQTYGRLAYYLIKVSHILNNYDVSQAKDLLVKNLYNRKERVHEDYLFPPLIHDDDKAVVSEYEELKTRMIESLHAKDEPVFGFTYHPEDIPDFCEKVVHNDGLILSGGKFSSSLDADRIVSMLQNCTSAQLDAFRSAFTYVYRASNVTQYLPHERPAIEELLSKLKELQDYEGYGYIQKTQISYFISNLKDALTRL